MGAYYAPSVFSPLACVEGCTFGPVVGVCAGAAGAGGGAARGAVVVVFVGALVGYLRAAEPAVLAPLDAEAPMVMDYFCWDERGEEGGIKCGVSARNLLRG